MQRNSVLLILEAAYELSDTTQGALRRIARAAAKAVPHGPVAVGQFEADAPLDLRPVQFERADERYMRDVLAWQRAVPAGVRRQLLSLAPGAIAFHAEARIHLPVELRARARELFALWIAANTGDGRGLHIAFGDPGIRDWPRARGHRFDPIAQHLAVAWRIRMSLGAAKGFAAAAEPTPSAREVLRRTVLDRERARAGLQATTGRALWPALIAGRWSLLDAFTAGGTRYVVAHENPPAAVGLRALRPRERAVLELVLDGRSGKWIAFELRLSESTVARTLRTALRRIGAADTADLAGVRTAVFETLQAPTTGGRLAITGQALAVRSLNSLTEAERAVVRGILGGKRIAAIAHERRTSSRTVGHQIASVYRKLEVSSRAELLALLAG